MPTPLVVSRPAKAAAAPTRPTSRAMRPLESVAGARWYVSSSTPATTSATPAMTSPVQNVSRASQRWSLRIHEAAKTLLQKL